VTTPLLSLYEIAEGVVNQAVVHNTALRQIEAFTVRALSKDETAPPGSPAESDAYIIAAGATGAWSGKDDQVAGFIGGAWQYREPFDGYTLTVADLGASYRFDGAAWVLSSDPTGDIAAAVAAHEAASDPHTGYLKESDTSAYGRSLIDDADAAAARTTLGLGTAATLAADTDATLAADSDTRFATQKAVRAYVASVITGGASDVMIFKGVIDCSANPNYPAADAGNLYKVSVAGKIGGASGANVEVGDTIYCITDATSSGTQAGVGANWVITQVNIDGAVVGPASAVNNRVVFFDGTTGKLIKDSGLTLAGTNTGDETTTSEGALINGATAKTTPVDADFMGLMDSAASNVLKKVSWANIKATLKAYFDTLYAPAVQPFTIATFYPGVPGASALTAILPAPAGVTTLTFAAAIAGSSGKALTAATAQADFDVRKNATTAANGTSVGTIRFAASGTVPTFIAASGFTLTGGTDYLTVWAPGTPDATLADIGVALYATR
jgi:hypothetical protein